MKKIITILSLWLSLSIALENNVKAADSTFIDYQNYNHGYCPECSCYPCRCDVPYYAEPVAVPPQGVPPPPPLPEPCAIPDPCADSCDPCAPVCGTQCGLTICTIGVVMAAVAATAAIIISGGEGSKKDDDGDGNGLASDPSHAHG